jgi:cytochrome c peroxidase
MLGRAMLPVGLLMGLLSLVPGCGSPAPQPPVAEKPSAAEPMAPVAAPAVKPTEVAKSESAPSEIEPSASSETEKVILGSPDLTAGIPGSGPLSTDDIKKWLADPKNFRTLEVELPLGLSAGAQQIKGLKENPLSRAKIELGRQLYFDNRLSGDVTISCAGCHDPGEGFARHSQFGVGVRKQEGNRNSPVSYNRILSDKQFWDGRANSLEDQAKGPIANPIEMGHTHEACVACLREVEGYKLQFDKIFGELTIDSVAKAIASFERVLVTGPSPFDYNEQIKAYAGVDPDDLKQDDPKLFEVYQATKAAAEKHPMSDSAKRGREIYFSDKGSCSACHVGANLTDEQYHNIGVGMSAKEPDLGRFVVTKDDKDKGAFKTPTIRNVALSAPYMHDGSLKTLEEVVELYAKGGEANPHLDPKIKKLNLSEQDKKDLIAFMQACTGDFPKIERGRLPK